jgi:hypothetical protein
VSGSGYYWERCSRHAWAARAPIREAIPLENIVRLVRLILHRYIYLSITVTYIICKGDKSDDEGSNDWCCRPNPSGHKDKKRTRKSWDAEWGRIGKEGNLWWVDSSPDDPRSQQISGKRRQWEEVMGRSVWEWLLPIGNTQQKGFDYRPNPRFDANGRWRKRREWPPELR